MWVCERVEGGNGWHWDGRIVGWNNGLDRLDMDRMDMVNVIPWKLERLKGLRMHWQVVWSLAFCIFFGFFWSF